MSEASPSTARATVLTCPRCQVALRGQLFGEALVAQCVSCAGLWMEGPAFAELSQGRGLAQALAPLGHREVTPGAPPEATRPMVSCPACSAQMDRFEFADASGVILDACRAGHGAWFDREELSRIIGYLAKPEHRKQAEAAWKRRQAARARARESLRQRASRPPVDDARVSDRERERWLKDASRRLRPGRSEERTDPLELAAMVLDFLVRWL